MFDCYSHDLSHYIQLLYNEELYPKQDKALNHYFHYIIIYLLFLTSQKGIKSSIQWPSLRIHHCHSMYGHHMDKVERERLEGRRGRGGEGGRGETGLIERQSEQMVDHTRREDNTQWRKVRRTDSEWSSYRVGEDNQKDFDDECIDLSDDHFHHNQELDKLIYHLHLKIFNWEEIREERNTSILRPIRW